MNNEKSNPRLWRQGDALIQETKEIPQSHLGFLNPQSPDIYVNVVNSEATLTHQDHGPITLE